MYFADCFNSTIRRTCMSDKGHDLLALCFGLHICQYNWNVAVWDLMTLINININVKTGKFIKIMGVLCGLMICGHNYVSLIMNDIHC